MTSCHRITHAPMGAPATPFQVHCCISKWSTDAAESAALATCGGSDTPIGHPQQIPAGRTMTPCRRLPGAAFSPPLLLLLPLLSSQSRAAVVHKGTI